ncbi:MAG: DUF86 domain-containing protein [Defluviitaleaceae bacterium]|nr:DUF86 domain-containing protein [Defluviitaleaceae bacterium]
MSTVNIKIHLDKILNHCQDILTDTANCTGETFKTTYIMQRAVFMSIIQIGELAGRLPAQFRVRHKNIPWTSMRHTRNVIVHDYVAINLDMIWDVVVTDIPILINQITNILQEIEKGNETQLYEKD